MDNPQNLHLVMFPWLAFGHITPFFELSKSFAQKDHHISFVSTPRNIQRLPEIPPNLSHLIDLIKLPLPYTCDEENEDECLPADAEATVDLPFNKHYLLKKAYDGLEKPLTQFLENSKPDWIIHDFASGWLPSIASNLGISSGVFYTFNASVMSYLGSPLEFMAMADNGGSRASLEDWISPPKWIPFPSNLAYKIYELIKLSKADEKGMGKSDMKRMCSAMIGCDVVFVRTCLEIEAEWVELLQDLYQKRVIPIGLIPPTIRETSHIEKDENWLMMKSWLGEQKEKSVIYVALGTEATLSPNEITELAYGLELSQLPFIWIQRTPPGASDDYWVEMLPSGFKKRTKSQGLVCSSWVPQLQILSHKSIGCFVTHCGWNSIIEGLGFGCPLVLLPIMNDQPLVARLLSWKKIGLEVPREEQTGELKREELVKAVMTVMLEEEGEIFRGNAQNMKEIFGNKVLQQRYTDEFEQFLKSHRRQTGLLPTV